MAKFVADLHLHSSYSRATSPSLNFDTLAEWAKLKGIQLLASADFTHPVWWKITREKLKESKQLGFYEYAGIQFVLGTEISCIYSQGGQQRRIHCLVFFPEMDDVEEFNRNLSRIGNLAADGRPILGISAKELLARALQVNEKAIFIPAHAWTPWFSLYGSNSGFDSIEECFGDLSKYIYAIETGLSSDPAMNWRIAELDSRSIVSFSDAHSCPKMGREVTVFDTNFSYEGLLAALKSAQQSGQQFYSSPNPRESTNSKNQDAPSLVLVETQKLDQPTAPAKIDFTIEFFPEEGKYHFTGHRSCGVRHSPEETAKSGIICPNCKKKLTIGVMHRVEQLADKNRPEGYKPKERPPFKRLVPLLEILAESLGSPVNSQKVVQEYKRLVSLFGSEIAILLKTPIDDLEKQTVPRIAEGIKRVREGDIVVDPGYDGVYGTVRIWPASTTGGPEGGPGEKQKLKPLPQAKGQAGLFD